MVWNSTFGGDTTHTHISKIWDLSLPLSRETPFTTSHSYGCSHHQSLFCFWLMLISPLSAFPTSPPHGNLSLIQEQQKRARWIFFLSPWIILVISHHSPKPSPAPFGNQFIPNPKCFGSPATPASLPFLFPTLPGVRISHLLKLLNSWVKAFK